MRGTNTSATVREFGPNARRIQSMRERRARRIKDGDCIDCGRAESVFGCQRCSECREKNNAPRRGWYGRKQLRGIAA